MIKTFKISGREVAFKATASTLNRFKNETGKDLIVLIDKMNDTRAMDTDILMSMYQLCYVMAQQCDPGISSKLDDWLDQFDVFPIDQVQEIVQWFTSTMTTSVELKKVQGRRKDR